MGAEAVVESSATDHEGVAAHGLVCRRAAVGLRRGTEIQRREANLVAGRDAARGHHRREQSDRMEWTAERSRVNHVRYPEDFAFMANGTTPMANGEVQSGFLLNSVTST